MALKGPNYKKIQDFAVGLVVCELLTHYMLLPEIRIKRGAYDAQCSLSESGVMTLSSYRDPNIS